MGKVLRADWSYALLVMIEEFCSVDYCFDDLPFLMGSFNHSAIRSGNWLLSSFICTGLVHVMLLTRRINLSLYFRLADCNHLLHAA